VPPQRRKKEERRIYYSQIAQIWCQSEEAILLRQLSCLEATARHAHVVPGRVFLCFNRTVPQSIENTTPSLSWSEKETPEKETSSSKRLCPCTRGSVTFRARILTILSRSVMTTNNSAIKPYFSLLCANSVVR